MIFVSPCSKLWLHTSMPLLHNSPSTIHIDTMIHAAHIRASSLKRAYLFLNLLHTTITSNWGDSNVPPKHTLYCGWCNCADVVHYMSTTLLHRNDYCYECDGSNVYKIIYYEKICMLFLRFQSYTQVTV